MVTDHIGLFAADHADYLAYVRDPRNGFASAPCAMNEGTELSIRTAPGSAVSS
ncbi:MAG: hypothetical protein MJE77_26570 [Proteobacteria bacterium]|nr:hypothetical protein [Pseudomonadota bacterium]